MSDISSFFPILIAMLGMVWLAWRMFPRLLRLVLRGMGWVVGRMLRVFGIQFKPVPPVPPAAPTTGQHRPHGNPVAGIQIEIEYQDFAGDCTRRVVSVQGFSKSRRGAPGYLEAFCYLRQEPRTFRLDRIVQAVDMETGEILEDLEAFLSDRKAAARAVAG